MPLMSLSSPMRLGALLASLAVLAPPLMGEPQSATPPQIEAATDETATPWTSLAANDAPEDFHFVIVTDRTGGERRGVFPAAMPKVNLLEPAFVVERGRPHRGLYAGSGAARP